MNPAVSVICPVYQAEAYLRRCVDSVLAQSFTNFELLLVDDGSTDRSGVICDEYAAKDGRVHVIHQANGGVCSARNRGIEEARGEYTIHVDPDDWVEPDFLSILYEKAQGEGADMVFCDYFLNWQNREILQRQQPTSLDHKSIQNDLLHTLHGACWNKLIRRACYSERGLHFPPHLTIWEDLYFNVVLCQQPIKVAYVPQPLYHYDYAVNANSLVRKGDQRTLDSQCWVIDQLSAQLDDPSLLDDLKIMTKERAFITKPRKGSQVKNLYQEVNEKYLSHRNYMVPLWCAMSITLRLPLLYPVVERLLTFYYWMLGGMVKLKGKWLG